MKNQTGILMMGGASKSATDIRYLSGFTAGDPFLCLHTPEQTYLVVSPMEKGRAQMNATPNTTVFDFRELNLRKPSVGKPSGWAMGLLKKLGMNRVAVTADFPVSVYKELEKKGIKLSILKEATAPQRIVKSEEEIACLRESQRAAVTGMKSAIQLIASADIDSKQQLRVGKKFLTSEIVRRQIQTAALEYDCIAMDTIVAGGDQGVDCHNPGHGPLYAGQSIVMDIFPRSDRHGYWGDITRTVCRGPASPELKKLYNTVKTAQLNALKMVKPGVAADEIHKGIQALFEKRGYRSGLIDGANQGFIHGTGHGVGLDIHEQPSIGAAKTKLEPGHVITIEPGLYYFGLGGVRIEDTVVVTKDGFSFLVPCVKTFEI